MWRRSPDPRGQKSAGVEVAGSRINSSSSVAVGLDMDVESVNRFPKYGRNCPSGVSPLKFPVSAPTYAD